MAHVNYYHEHAKVLGCGLWMKLVVLCIQVYKNSWKSLLKRTPRRWSQRSIQVKITCVRTLGVNKGEHLVKKGTYRIAGNFRGVQFSWKGNLQRFCGLIFADGCSRTAPPTIPGWLCLLPHMCAPAQKLGCRRSSRFVRYFPSEQTSLHKSASLQPLHSQQCVFLSEIRRKVRIVASFSSIRTLFGFDHSLHFCVSWFYGRRWHCRRQRATWIRKLGSITRRLKIVQRGHSCRSSTITNWWAACKSRWPRPLLIACESFISRL